MPGARANLTGVSQKTFTEAGYKMNFEQVTGTPAPGAKQYHASSHSVANHYKGTTGYASAQITYNPANQSISIEASHPADASWAKKAVSRMARHFEKAGARLSQASRGLRAVGPWHQIISYGINLFADERDADDSTKVKARLEGLKDDPFRDISFFLMGPSMREKVIDEAQREFWGLEDA